MATKTNTSASKKMEVTAGRHTNRKARSAGKMSENDMSCMTRDFLATKTASLVYGVREEPATMMRHRRRTSSAVREFADQASAPVPICKDAEEEVPPAYQALDDILDEKGSIEKPRKEHYTTLIEFLKGMNKMIEERMMAGGKGDGDQQELARGFRRKISDGKDHFVALWYLTQIENASFSVHRAIEELTKPKGREQFGQKLPIELGDRWPIECRYSDSCEPYYRKAAIMCMSVGSGNYGEFELIKDYTKSKDTDKGKLVSPWTDQTWEEFKVATVALQSWLVGKLYSRKVLTGLSEEGYKEVIKVAIYEGVALIDESE